MFQRVLIANRGEIAARVSRTCRRLGIESHAVYSVADADALHVREADGATHIGAAPVAESYINVEAVLDAAVEAGCDAVHPGYGLLSENGHFAQACDERGITFIGPDAAHMELMGNKNQARATMRDLSMPVIPGSAATVADEDAEAVAEEVGYPLLIKASYGGGGIGMATVKRPNQFSRSLRRARSSALRAFGSDEVYLERLLVEPHHIELQVFGDGQGNAAILGDRECSVQRRHQKVIEEAPAPAPHLTDDLRERLYGQVRRAVAGLNYRNAGTVECLLDASGEIFFLEMNTRLQVEHPVTEMVTGLDLVEWQIRIAAGEPLTELPGYGDPPPISGHAIETRIYAEDPETLLPSPGSIDILEVPDEPWLRLDAGVASGDEVSHFYDPLMAKLIVHGEDRAQALARLRIALDGSRIEGLKHNIPFLQRVLDAQPFIEGNYDVTLTDGLLKA
ncbi:MAG: biotin carboxylase [Chloroflexi bacterium]|nr:biotin carboxylase [Chloroflexota bacterium]